MLCGGCTVVKTPVVKVDRVDSFIRAQTRAHATKQAHTRQAWWLPTMLSIPEMYVVRTFIRAISLKSIVRHESIVVRTENVLGYYLCSVGV